MKQIETRKSAFEKYTTPLIQTISKSALFPLKYHIHNFSENIHYISHRPRLFHITSAFQKKKISFISIDT